MRFVITLKRRDFPGAFCLGLIAKKHIRDAKLMALQDRLRHAASVITDGLIPELV